MLAAAGRESVGNASCPSTLGWSSHISLDVAASKPEDTKFFDFRHSKSMNVIYGDYSVRSVELADLKAPAFTRNRWLGTE